MVVPVVCGVDPGVASVGLAVIDTDVRVSEVLPLPPGEPASRCRWLVAQIGRRCRQSRVEVLAIETMRWYGRHVTTAPMMLLLIGALSVVEGPRQVLLIEAPTWQQAIVGGPAPSDPRATRTAWKRLVRGHVERALLARGMTWRFAGSDSGGHRFDALGLSLFAQDVVSQHARLRGSAR